MPYEEKRPRDLEWFGSPQHIQPLVTVRKDGLVHSCNEEGGTLVCNYPEQERERVQTALLPGMAICNESYNIYGGANDGFSLHITGVAPGSEEFHAIRAAWWKDNR